MRPRPFRCDTNRLRTFLDDGLDEDERLGLADHLGTCRSCQRALERLAAGSALWRSLGQLGRNGPATPPGADRGPGATGNAGGPGQADDDEPLEFLAPPCRPGDLGLLGPYEITDVLGRGGMGVVLKARDSALNRVVAIKVLAPQLATSGAARKRFAREARAAAAVVHEHVIAIHAVDSWNGLPYLVMPYIAGRSLQERIDRDGPLEVKEVLRIGMQAARGLAAAHAQGLVHRDVKPSNILLENGVERVWLTDFGLARAADDASLTHSGMIAGTPQYMAPEQARGEAFDHRADLFSLGSVLYAMCAGHPPFRAGTTLAVLRRVSDERPRPLHEVDPELPGWLAAIVERLHAQKPADRYQSADAVAEELEGNLAELQRPTRRISVAPAHPAKPIPVAPSLPVARSRRRLVALAAAAVLLLGTLGVTGYSGSARNTSNAGSSLIATGLVPVLQDRGKDGGPPAVVAGQKNDGGSLIVGSGKPATKDFAIADFDSLEVMHPFQVEVVRADRFGVTVTTDDNVLEHVKAVKTDSTLKIALEENKSYHIKAGSMKAKVSMPALAALGITHGARGTVSGFKSDRAFKARASHGSLLEGEVEAGDIWLDASHGSTLDLKGKARDGKLAVSHGSTLIANDLALRAVEIDTQHGSTSRFNARSPEVFKASAHHGSILIGSVEAGDVTVEAAHGSQAILKGTARRADLSAGHGSKLAVGGLTLESAKVNVSQGSSATVNAKDSLEYHLDHGSHLRYVGKPRTEGSKSSRDASARSISAEEAAQASPATPREPSKPRRAPEGDIFISTFSGGTQMIRMGGFAAGTIVGSGKPASRAVDLSGFKSIEAHCPCTVEVTRDDAFRVSLTADDNVLEHFKAEKDGETLRILLDQGNYQLVGPLKATVTMPAIEGVTFGGAARAKVQGFDSDRPFHAKLDGASRLEGSIKAGDFDLDAEGASQVTLRGAARAARIKASGASRLELKDLHVGTAEVNLSGASRAAVNARERLGYSVSGASHLEYSGEPTVKGTERSGASRVSHAR